MKSVLDIFLYEEKIGSINSLGGERSIFVFDDDYIKDKDRNTLSQSFYNVHGELITNTKPTHVQLSSFFSNLLPEGSLRELVARKNDINLKREFWLMRSLGGDMPGAVTAQINNEGETPSSFVHSDNSREEENLKFSLAGMQLKFSTLMEPSGRITFPSKGIGGDWIVKMPSYTFDGVPENEWSMMQLAQKIGLDVPKIKLSPTSSIFNLPISRKKNQEDSLVIKRFDREDGKKIHIEDFAQVFGVYPANKYKKVSYGNIGKMIYEVAEESSFIRFIKQLILSICIGNADLHLKNLSLIYPNRKDALLSPAYDLVSTIAYIDDKKLALTLSGEKDMTKITVEHFIELANRANFPIKRMKAIVLKSSEEIRGVWNKEKKEFPMIDSHKKQIDRHMKFIKI